MSKLLIKSAGTWTYPESVYVKQNDRWKSVREVWVKEGDEWKVSWPNNTGTLTYSEPSFGVFQVPDGVYSIEIYWPTSSTYISSSTLAVTPGSQISYRIGEPGESSDFGGVSTTKVNREVARFRGVVDHTLTQKFTVVSTSTSTYSNYEDSVGLDATDLAAAVLAQGLYYEESNETLQGDKLTNISLTPMLIDNILPSVDYRVEITETNFAGGGTSIVMQQPTSGNSYVAGVNTGDPVGTYSDNNVHYFILNFQQVTPISIKWGDWSQLLPISVPFITLISPSTGTTAGGTPITISGTGFTGATGATLDGAPIASFNVVSDTTATGVTPAGSIGSASIVITRPGSSGSTNGLFTYI